jgi:hypothetical protein
LVYNKYIKKPTKNIIIQVDINYKSFEENYEIFLSNLNLDELRKEAKIPEADKLKKNGTFERGVYYTVDGNLEYSRIKIQKLQQTAIIDGKEKKIYLSVFPSFIIKYGRVSVDTIELISKNIRKGEDIFTAIDDLNCLLSSEDPLDRACARLNNVCIQNNYSSILNTLYTEVYESPISFFELINTLDTYRYPAVFELYRTGQIFIEEAGEYGILSTLNRIFKFLR